MRNEILNQKTVRIKTTDYFDANSIDEDLEEFIHKIVPWDSAALLIRKGIIAPIDELSETSESRFPLG